MARTIFIFGAGASADAGVPTMNSFLDEAEKLYNLKDQSPDISKFKVVFEAMSDLQLIHSKAQIDLKNIESFFAAVELAILLKIKIGVNDDINVLRESIIFLIYKTIEHRSIFERNANGVQVQGSYNKFTQLLKDTVLTQGRQSIALITFNYDICLDYAIHSIGLFPDYGFEHISYYRESSIPLLKLHGSLNWARCSNCSNLSIYFLDQYQFRPNNPRDNIMMPIGSVLKSRPCEKCQSVSLIPFIVPPTWNKTSYQSYISNIWEKAAQNLSETENIFVIGYSFPASDHFFHYLYALGTMGKSRLKNFVVLNPDPEVDKKFRDILGQQALQRYRYKVLSFRDSIPYIRNVLFD